MSDFLKQLDKTLVSGLTVFVILIISLLCWKFNANEPVPMWVLCIIIITCYFICLIEYTILSKKKDITYTLPKVKSIIKNNDNNIIFIVEENQLYTQGAYITIAYQESDDDIEILLGLGYIETINNQKNLQIIFKKIVNTEQVTNIIRNLSNNKKSKESIKIKPAIQHSLIEEN